MPLRLCLASMLCLAAISPLHAQTPASTRSLVQNFRTPPATARPWVFWMWLRVQTNRKAITRDLEEMRAKGIEGAILYDSGVGGGMEADRRMIVEKKEFRAVPTTDYQGAHFTPIPEPPMPSWQPASREMVRFAAKEAARLGVKLVLTVGLASTSGDIELQDSQQRLVWSETRVAGGRLVSENLATPAQAVPSSRVAVRSMVPERAEVGAHPEEQQTIRVLAIPSDRPFTQDLAVDLSSRVDEKGNLQWQAPAGSWRVFRFAYEPTHMRNAWGLYTDAMSSSALDHTWDVTMGRLLREMTADERRGLYGVEDDSWEAGASTWTAAFATEFRQRRGYDLSAWLPVLAGVQTQNQDTAEGVRRDFYRTVADLIAEHHYGHLAQLAQRNGLVSFSEAAGPNSGELDPEQDASEIDVPMGEFWMPSQHRPTPAQRFLMHDAASSGHVYGRRIIACESLTSVGPHWEETLFDLKNTADQGFTEGCNSNVIHNFSQSPAINAKPGYVYFAGTHYDRGNTWWNQTPAFNTYLARTSHLLQQGHFVADALYYRGDGIGQLEQLKKPLPLPGYDHDNINLDALTRRLTVRDGRLMLPDGMSYRLLILPNEERIALPALQKIAALVRDGATVIGPKPLGIAGLATPEQEQIFADLASHLWPAAPHAGNHVLVSSAQDVLKEMKLAPDLQIDGISPQGELDWIHRRLGQTEIYFIASRWDPVERVSATFRVSGLQPEIWDPVTGVIRDAIAFQQKDGLTNVPLRFDPRGSVFVVFREKISSATNGIAASNERPFEHTQQLTGSWQVSFDPKLGGPTRAAFPGLVDWTTRTERSIRYYSGDAKYHTAFTVQFLPKPGERVFLNLGEVHEEADVSVNGILLGTVWTRPARVDITRALRRGINTLDVVVTNLWVNRLIGDEGLPREKRITTTNAHKFSSDTPLLPSGLIGPVFIEND